MLGGGARPRGSGTLLGVFVADEEIASEGAKFYAGSGPKIHAAVVGEADLQTRTFTAHKGSLRPMVRVYGVSATFPVRRISGRTRSIAPESFLALLPSITKMSCVIAHIQLVRRGKPDSHPHERRPRRQRAARRMRSSARSPDGSRRGRGRAVKREIGDLLALVSKRFGVRAEIIGYKATTGGATETAADAPIVAGEPRLRAAPMVSPSQGPSASQGGCDPRAFFRKLGAQGTVIGPGDLAVCP